MKKHSILAACALTACSMFAHADAWTPIGAKGLAMAGAQVANPEGSQAVNINPAALAKEGRFDMALPINLTVGSEGTLIQNANDLYDSYTNNGISAAFENLKGTPSNNDVAKVTNFFTEDAKVLDKPGQGVLVNVTGALTARVKRFGISAGTRIYGGATVVYDGSGFTPSNSTFLVNDNTSLNLTAADTAGLTVSTTDTAIATAAAKNSDGTDLTFEAGKSAITGTEIAYYTAAIKAGRDGDKTAALTADETSLLTDIARDINKSNATGFTQASTADAASFNNNTGLVVKALAIKEVGLSYAFTMSSMPKLHFAPTLKIMKGEAVSSTILLSDATSKDVDIEDKLDEDSNSKSSTEFGIDLGLLYEHSDKLTFGLMLKDITSPSFETNSGLNVEIDMGARAGAAYEYSQKAGWRGLITADLDLIKSSITALESADSQFIAFGISQELMGWLSLRGGLNSNIGGESNGINYSAGLGIQISKLFIDISGQLSSDEVTVDGDDFPTRGGFGITLGWNMNF
jgi:hypothetical protein